MITINGKTFQGRNVSIINGNVVVDGVMKTFAKDRDILIKGDFTGNIDATEIIIEGNVIGNIDATNVTVSGSITGDIDAVNVISK